MGIFLSFQIYDGTLYSKQIDIICIDAIAVPAYITSI